MTFTYSHAGAPGPALPYCRCSRRRGPPPLVEPADRCCRPRAGVPHHQCAVRPDQISDARYVLDRPERYCTTYGVTSATSSSRYWARFSAVMISQWESRATAPGPPDPSLSQRDQAQVHRLRDPGEDVPVCGEVGGVDDDGAPPRPCLDRGHAQLVEVGRRGVLDQGLTRTRPQRGAPKQVAGVLRLIDPVRPAVDEFPAPFLGEQGVSPQLSPSATVPGVPVQVTEVGVADVEGVANRPSGSAASSASAVRR